MNYPSSNYYYYLVYFYRDVWVEGSAIRAGALQKKKKKNLAMLHA